MQVFTGLSAVLAGAKLASTKCNAVASYRGEFLWGFHIVGHTPGAQGVHPSRPRHGSPGELDAAKTYVLGNQEIEPTRFCLIRSPERASGIVAIVIALRDDLAALELQKRGEVGAQLRSCRLGLTG